MMTLPSTAPLKIFISTGDTSGDAHACAVVDALVAQYPNCEIKAVGNEQLAAHPNVTLVAHHQQVGMGQVGLAGLLNSIPAHWQLANQTIAVCKAWQPDVVLLIDYGGYHLQLAKRLNKRWKVAYYIPPQVWASRAKRINTIKQFVHHVFCIFPFETALYQQAGIPVTYVGHPLMGQLPTAVEKFTLCQQLGLEVTRPVIGLFPGSRTAEIHYCLPLIFASVPALVKALAQKGLPAPQFVLAKAGGLKTSVLEKVITQANQSLQGIPVKIVSGQNYAILSGADLIIGASGTTTLEAALYKTPMVIAYKLDAFTAWVAKRVIQVPYLGLPNLLVPKETAPILPELLQDAFTTEAVTAASLPLLDKESSQWQHAHTGFETIATLLQLPNQQSPAQAVATGLLVLVNQPD
jgi:lipid-A-disaccharide synthase